MASTFTWLDYSEQDRRQMLDVVALFRERTTLDELGIGTVRDALADLLFPGINTIQTRARYFLFIPWIYQHLEAQQVPSNQITARARQAELALIRPLQSAGEQGVFGSVAGQALQRLPSSVYWSGLEAWHIRLFPGSQSDYHRYLDRHYREVRQYKELQREQRSGVDGPAEGEAAPPRIWHAGLPSPPDGFPQGITFRLRPGEAIYLRERIVAWQRHSYLAYLLDYGGDDNLHPRSSDFPWLHLCAQTAPTSTRKVLAHARNFSECIYGASLLYNWLLARRRDEVTPSDQWQQKAVTLQQEMYRWQAQLMQRQEVLQSWTRQHFWETVLQINPHITHPTRNFIDQWLDLSLNEQGTWWSQQSTHLMIAERERRLKGSLARLRYDRPLERWTGTSSPTQLEYRWGNVRTFLDDVAAALLEAE